MAESVNGTNTFIVRPSLGQIEMSNRTLGWGRTGGGTLNPQVSTPKNKLAHECTNSIPNFIQVAEFAKNRCALLEVVGE